MKASSSSSSESTDKIPLFGPKGNLLTEDERLTLAQQRGICLKCGIRTHEQQPEPAKDDGDLSKFLSILSLMWKSSQKQTTEFTTRLIPLTNDNVMDGICIGCYPSLVPQHISKVWSARQSSSTTDHGPQTSIVVPTTIACGGPSYRDVYVVRGGPLSTTHTTSTSRTDESHTTRGQDDHGLELQVDTSNSTNSMNVAAVHPVTPTEMTTMPSTSSSSVPIQETPPTPTQLPFTTQPKRISSSATGATPSLPTAMSLTVFQASPLAYEDTSGNTNPIGLLELDEEMNNVQEALEKTNVTVKFETATTTNLQTFFCTQHEHQEHILHLSCHGQPEYLFIENDYGAGQVLLVDEHLKSWIEIAGSTTTTTTAAMGSCRTLNSSYSSGIVGNDEDNVLGASSHHQRATTSSRRRGSDVGSIVTNNMLSLVFVSACHSGNAGKMFVRAGIPHVVCCETAHKISDIAAKLFTRFFYQALGHGNTLQYSFNAAIESMKHASEMKRTPGLNAQEEAKKFLLLPPTGTIIRDADGTEREVDHEIVLFPRLDDDSMLTPLTPRRISARATSQPIKSVMLLPPLPPQYFLGREVDMYRILKAMIVTKARLIRITGPKGIGKETLAKAVGHFIAKRKLWGNVLLWLPSTTIVQDDLADDGSDIGSSTHSRENLMTPWLDLFAQLQQMTTTPTGIDHSSWNKDKNAILGQLAKRKAVIIINTKELSKLGIQKLSELLDDIFERTRQVKVLLVCHDYTSQYIKSKHVTGFQCSEKKIKVPPLDPVSTMVLFGKVCPHATTAMNNTTVTWSMETLSKKHSTKVVRKVLGNGIPAKTIILARNMERMEYNKLLAKSYAPVGMHDFQVSFDHLHSVFPESGTVPPPPKLGEGVESGIVPKEPDASPPKLNSNEEDQPRPLRSQVEVWTRFHPLLKKEGSICRKRVSGYIRRARKGERIITTIDGVQETAVNVKDDNCWVVFGRAASEYYVVTDTKFREYYDEYSVKPIEPGSFDMADRLIDNGFSEYAPIRRVYARRVDSNDMAYFRRQNNEIGNTNHNAELETESTAKGAYFMAPWGEPTFVDEGDFLLMTYPGSDRVEDADIYRIERAVFGKTYVDCKTPRSLPTSKVEAPTPEKDEPAGKKDDDDNLLLPAVLCAGAVVMLAVGAYRMGTPSTARRKRW